MQQVIKGQGGLTQIAQKYQRYYYNAMREKQFQEGDIHFLLGGGRRAR